MATKEVAAKKEAGLPAAALDAFETAAVTGFEGADAQSYAIPFLIILQSNSPQVKRSEGAYVAGAQEGMLFNTVTEEVYDVGEGGTPLTVIPVSYKRSFIEWVLREKGGGIVAEYDVAEGQKLLTQCERDDKNRDILPNGNELKDTRYHYVLLQGGAVPKPAVISMTRTGIKKSKRWMSVMSETMLEGKNGPFQAPMFAFRYNISTVPEQKDGNSWWNWKIEQGTMVDRAEIVTAAMTLQEGISSGAAKVDAEAEQTTEAPVDSTAY
jgi:hypothetical protein